MKRALAGLLFTAALAWGQNYELGAGMGLGGFVGQGVYFTKFAMVGLEGCGYCTGRFAVFGEYTHWENLPKRDYEEIRRADLVAGGLRIQGRGRTRPFFDVGLAGGQDRYGFGTFRGTHNLIGAVLGGGVGISLGERFYLRPQYRLYVLSDLHIATGASVAFGYRF